MGPGLSRQDEDQHSARCLIELDELIEEDKQMAVFQAITIDADLQIDGELVVWA